MLGNRKHEYTRVLRENLDSPPQNDNSDDLCILGSEASFCFNSSVFPIFSYAQSMFISHVMSMLSTQHGPI